MSWRGRASRRSSDSTEDEKISRGESISGIVDAVTQPARQMLLKMLLLEPVPTRGHQLARWGYTIQDVHVLVGLSIVV